MCKEGCNWLCYTYMYTVFVNQSCIIQYYQETRNKPKV